MANVIYLSYMLMTPMPLSLLGLVSCALLTSRPLDPTAAIGRARAPSAALAERTAPNRVRERPLRLRRFRRFRNLGAPSLPAEGVDPSASARTRNGTIAILTFSAPDAARHTEHEYVAIGVNESLMATWLVREDCCPNSAPCEPSPGASEAE